MNGYQVDDGIPPPDDQDERHKPDDEHSHGNASGGFSADGEGRFSIRGAAQLAWAGAAVVAVGLATAVLKLVVAVVELLGRHHK